MQNHQYGHLKGQRVLTQVNLQMLNYAEKW